MPCALDAAPPKLSRARSPASARLAVIYFFRGFKSTGKLAVILERCIVDVCKFVSLYVLWNVSGQGAGGARGRWSRRGCGARSRAPAGRP